MTNVNLLLHCKKKKWNKFLRNIWDEKTAGVIWTPREEKNYT